MGTHTGNVITLANSIIGVSVLAMPFCFKQCGIILSILMLLFSNIISRLSCHYLMKSAIMEKRKNFEMLAFRAFGPTGKLMVELCIIGFLLGTCVAYFVIMGDLGPGIIGPVFGFQHPTALRPSVLIAIAIFVVLPLGLLKNVDSLSGVCAATIAFYTCLVLKVLGEAVEHLITADWMDKVYYWRPSGILQCIPIFSMALSGQTQLFEIFDSLPSTPLDRMNSVVRSATNMVTMFYISVGFFGYVAYCDQSFSGNLMMNFSKTMTSEVIKIGFLMSVAVSFPLVIFPCRASIHSLLFSKGYEHAQTGSAHIPESRFQCITLVIVTLALVIGLLIPNIELVLGLVGSTIGVVICVMIPGVIFVSLSSRSNNERLLAKSLVFIGLIIMVLGTYANLYATEEAISKPDVKPLRPPLADSIPNPILPKVLIKDETLEKLNDVNELAAALPDLKSESKVDPNQNDILKESVVNKGNIIESNDVKREPPVPEEPVAIKKEIKIPKLELPLKDVLSNMNPPKENSIPKVIVPLKVNSIADTPIKEETKKKSDLPKPAKNSEKKVILNNIKEKENERIIENKVKETKKEILIERIKEHQKAQDELIAKGEELINELKTVVETETRINGTKETSVDLNKNVESIAKNIDVNAKKMDVPKVKKVQPEISENLVHEDPIVVSMAKGVPLPLAVKGKVQMAAKENEEKKSEPEVEKVGRDILGGDPKELREKRDVEALTERSRAPEVNLSGQLTTPQPVKAEEVIKKTADVPEEPKPAKDVAVDEGSCVKNGSVEENDKKVEVKEPLVADTLIKSVDKLQDPLIKFSSHLSDPKPILNESPQLLENKAESIDAEMPKRRDLKSIETNDIGEPSNRNG